MKITTDTVIMSSIAHILGRLSRLDARMESMATTLDCIVEVLDEEREDDDDEATVDADAGIISDSLLDAAEDMERTNVDIPNREAVIDRLREIARDICGGRK